MHLTDLQMLEILEGRAPDDASGYAAACPDCRSEIDSLRAALAEVSSLSVPEPSPLFWTHFRARIDAAIEEGASAQARGLWSWRFGWLAASAAVLTMLLVMFASRHPREVELPIKVAIAEAPLVLTPADLADDDIDADEAWAVVRSVADDIDYDTAHGAGLSPAPGTLDRAAATLSAAEQAALVALIEQEMKRTDS